LVVAKVAGLLSREPGQGLDRAGGAAREWLDRRVEVTKGEDDAAAAALVAALKPLGIPVPEIRREVMPEVGTGRRRAERWRVPLPGRVSPVVANLAVTRAASGVGLDVLDAWEEVGDPDPRVGQAGTRGGDKGKAAGTKNAAGTKAAGAGDPVLTVVLGRSRDADYRLEFVRGEGPAGGSIAVVIDDFGLEWDETAEAFLRFPAPLTVGVLPGYKSSRQVADAARARGFEVLLHLPIEPERYPQVKPGPDAILVDHSAAEVRATMRRALRSVGKVEGISSHMGSRGTTDRDLMQTVLDETKRQGLFFVDTRTTSKSVVAEVAREQGAPFLINGLHLDEVRQPKRIAERLDEAMQLAEEDGEIVVVAHGFHETLAALEAALPKLAARGLKLVPASELVRAKTPAVL
jgi:polysaccharide deacetylase 2 family uncharacterized protein YibQ